MGQDGLDALTVVAPRVDREYGTNYAANVEAYRRHLMDTDASLALGMTDVKGDRSLRPSQQKLHQDYCVHIVKEASGGIVGTCPSAADYFNPEIHGLLDKYGGGVPAEHRLRLVKLIRAPGSSYEDIITLHAEGSLAAQKLSIYALADFDRYKTAAKMAARIEDGSTDRIYSQLSQFPPLV